MKVFFPVLLALWTLVTFTGCSDMIRSLREESASIDEEADRESRDVANDATNLRKKTVRGLSANNVQSYDSARSYSRRLASRLPDESGLGSTDLSDASPPVAYRRVTRDDFVDKKIDENSLWDAQGQGNYLFANNRRREVGDLLTADVEKELRREIQYQLWLTLPPDQRRTKKSAAGVGQDMVNNVKSGLTKDANALPGVNGALANPVEAKNKDAAEEAAKTNITPNGKDDDLIRMEVMENLGNGLVRVVGQKRVIYKGASRVVEVVAIVNNRDVDDNNHVKSSNFLDMRSQVIQ